MRTVVMKNYARYDHIIIGLRYPLMQIVRHDSLKLGMLCGQTNHKCRTFSWFALSPDGSAMPLYYLLADGKAHAGTFIRAASAVEPLEWGENPVDILFFEADAIIFNSAHCHCSLTVRFLCP
jgi:hypothetical protein